MRTTPTPLSALIATFLLLTAGCYYPADGRPVYATETQPAYVPQTDIPTSLVIVMEGEATEADYRARRLEIINYLIERGYIAVESDLVSDPANAVRIIRAIVTGEGFTLSVFNQGAVAEPQPDLEMTDILYPDDPYFIFGFDYLYEIGPRRLPPRPRDYRPHPRPPHSNPPPGHRDYDRDRHWGHGRPGQPAGQDGRGAPTPDRRNHGGNRPQPDRAGPPPANVPPGNNPAPLPETNPPARRPTPAPRPRLAPSPVPGRPPEEVQNPTPPPGNRPVAPNNGGSPPNNEHVRPDNNGKWRPDNNGNPHPATPPSRPNPATPNRNSDRPPPRDSGQPVRPTSPGGSSRSAEPARSAPPPARSTPPPPPAPAPAPAADNRDRPAEDKDRHEQLR